MTALTLTKSYLDGTLLFASHVTNMWAELETKTNGSIDSDNLVTGWTSWASVTLSADTSFTMGATASGVMRYYATPLDLFFGFASSQSNILFKIAGTTVMTIESDNDVKMDKDLYIISTGDNDYPVSYLVGYAKPVLVYTDSITVDIEQNTTTANKTLIMFPKGPVAVYENIAATSRWRRLKLSEYANGYTPGHAGASNSGFRSGLALISNTWYFVYAVIVQSGSDYSAASPKFVLVADVYQPYPYYHSTLDSFYGASNWVYIGCFRYGFGLSSPTTLIPFIQDKSGWHNFIGRADTDAFFGIKTVQTLVSTTTEATVQTYGVGTIGNRVPTSCSMMNTAWKATASGAGMNGNITVHDSAGNKILQGPSFGANLDITEPHGFTFKIPNIGCIVKAKTGV